MFAFVRIRNIWSLLAYGYTMGKINLVSMLINIAILVYSVLHFDDILGKGLWLFLFLVFVNIVWQTKSILEDVVSLFRYPEYNFDNHRFIEHIDLAEETKETYDHMVKNDDHHVYAIYSSPVNICLQGDDEIALSEIKETKTSLKDYIEQNKETLLLFLKTKWHQSQRATFFNEKKLCMKSELTETSEGKYCVKVCRGNYYNSFVTNEIYCKRLFHNDKSTYIYPPMNPFSEKIQPLSRDSSFSDHIGASTLVLTTDGYVIILSHNNRTAVHPNTYQPTCSGSADYADWQRLRKANITSLRAFVKEVVKRELFEETKIEGASIDHIEVTGFFRDLVRGGKPDFCTVTYLSISLDEAADLFAPDKKEVNNKLVSKKVRSREGFDFTAFDRFIDDNAGSVSPALYMSYLFMKQRLQPEKGKPCEQENGPSNL
ncbi:MAG: hypothetical protein IJ196_07420 [Prevotella sp.]|nr:hypothetical protein [Prevotella sp.]